jgi:hypothetical protein
MSSTLLFGLGQDGVTARLWSYAYGKNAAPETFDQSVGYPGVWDVRCTSPDELSIGFQAVPAGKTRVWFRKPGYSDQAFDTTMPDDGAKEIRLERAPVTLPPLVGIDSARHRFIANDGSRVFLKGATSFLLYKRHLDGEDITPQLAQLRDLGGNCIRILGMVASFAHWYPQEYGDRYYTQIQPFCALCESYGIYVLWTACADTGVVMPNENENIRHGQRTTQELIETHNAVFSYVNEQGQHENGINRQRWFHEVPTGWMRFDTGSFGEDAPCEPPFGTHVVLHARRAYPSHIKDMCSADHPNVVNAPHLQLLQDEPDRYGDEGNQNTRQCADSAGTAVQTCLGFVFHSKHGVRSETFRGNTLDCATAAFTAMRGA